MQSLYDLLSNQRVPTLLFVVIGLGYFLGNIRVRGFSLGISAVLFVGLVFGAIDPEAFVIPEVIYVLGLILFVYTIGLSSGPIFFNLFRRQWLKLTGIALIATCLSAAGALAASKILHLSMPVASGLFCGSLTNTPALAATVEALRGILTGRGVSHQEMLTALGGPTVGYSIAYPFGVLGLILTMYFVSRGLGINYVKEQERSLRVAGLGGDNLHSRDVRVTNPQLIGKTYGEALLTDLTGMVFTRIKRGDRINLVTDAVVLGQGDVLVGVGTREAIHKAELLIGPIVEQSVEQASPGIEYRDLVVINRKVVGRPIAELAQTVGRPVIVSRIRRGGIHITPHPETTLEMGDQIRIVSNKDDLDPATQLVGNPLRDITETDFLSFSFGLILGVAVGMIPIPIGGHTVSLGFAGGPLVVALILGRLGRTGPIVWTMPANANLTLRQLGLLCFLAGVGTRGGGSFVHTFLTQGAALLVTGAVITLLSAFVILLLAYKFFGYDMISTFGIMAGVHTQPAALAFANGQTKSEGPNVSYAAVYPIALIAKIILAQVLIGL